MRHSSITADRLRLALVLSTFAFLSATAPAADGSLRKFLDAHCVSCHDAATKKGGLDLEKLSADFKDPAAFASWVKIHDRIQSGEMPPKARKERPDKAESENVLKTLAAGLIDADQARRAGDGRAVFRRLNRTEYENTLRDLFDLPGLKVKDMLPEDGGAFGYNKSAAGLDLSYVQLAKYMEVADAALDAAIAPHADRPPVYKAHFPGGSTVLSGIQPANGHVVFMKDFKYDPVFPIPQGGKPGSPEKKELVAKLRKNPYPGTVGMFRTEIGVEFKPQFPFHPPYAGKYKLRISVWSFLWDKGEVKPNARTEAASLIVDGQTLAYFDAPSLKPTVTEIVVWLDPAAIKNKGIQFSTASTQGGDHNPGHIIQGNLAKAVHSGIAVDWLDVEGPLVDQWPPASHSRLFGDLPLVPMPPAPKGKLIAKAKGNVPPPDVHLPSRPQSNVYHAAGHMKPYIVSGSAPAKAEFSTVGSKAPEADARRLLADFLPRAFRRPVSPQEVERYVKLVKDRLDEEDVFEVAMRTAYKAALCSPDFLFLKETPGALNDWALASRLSYFLWNSMPDDALSALAAKGKLHDGAVLRGQVERMLKDPKAERFIVDFTDQWLDLKDIDDTTPDKKLYPEFRRILRDSMLGETRAFFRELLGKDLSATNVVHSDFTMLNERLASHYHIPGVVGSAIRRVPLPADSCRGGILTQAAVLKVTANGTVTSPVRRGAWVMNKIIGQPPDPPPGDVPAIEPDVRGTTSIRELLAKHRTNATCAACHKKIDPPGFALESFDVIGGQQTRYRSLSEEGDAVSKSETASGGLVRYTWGPKVDPAGELPDGRTFADIEGFKKLLLEDSRALARNLAGQLVTYATGAPVGFADREAVEKVLDKSAQSKYGIRTLIHEIVESKLFLTK
jgi:hypothetical protein